MAPPANVDSQHQEQPMDQSTTIKLSTMYVTGCFPKGTFMGFNA